MPSLGMGYRGRTEFRGIFKHMTEDVLLDRRVDVRPPNLSKTSRKCMGSGENCDSPGSSPDSDVPLQDRIQLFPTVDRQ